MAVAGDYGFEPGRCRLQIEFREIVQHVDGNASELDDFSFRQLAGPGGFVDIAANGGQWPNGRQFFQNLRSADVSRVKDAVRAL